MTDPRSKEQIRQSTLAVISNGTKIKMFQWPVEELLSRYIMLECKDKEWSPVTTIRPSFL